MRNPFQPRGPFVVRETSHPVYNDRGRFVRYQSDAHISLPGPLQLATTIGTLAFVWSFFAGTPQNPTVSPAPSQESARVATEHVEVPAVAPSVVPDIRPVKRISVAALKKAARQSNVSAPILFATYEAYLDSFGER